VPGGKRRYRALTASGDLFKTGPTGTNVNDLALVLRGGDYRYPAAFAAPRIS
jgi:hypothetical protein